MAITDINLTFSGNADQYLNGQGQPTDFPSPSTPPPIEQPNQFFAITTTESVLNPYTYYNGVANDGVGATITFSAVGLIKESAFLAGKIGNYTVEVGDDINIRNEVGANEKVNGLYNVTTNDLTNHCVLTRTVPYDTTSEITTSQISILAGKYAGSVYIQTTVDPIIGVDPIVFVNQPRTNSNPFLSVLVDTVTTDILPSFTYLNGSNPSRPGIGAKIRMNVNGVFPTINGVDPYVGMRVLVNAESNEAYHGDFVLTTLGNASQKAQLTRGYSAAFSLMRFQFAEFVVNNPSCDPSLFGNRYVLDQSTIIPDSEIGIAPLYYVQNNNSINEATQLALDGKEDNLPSMVGNALKVLRVNAGETAKEWATISTGVTVGTTPIASGTVGRLLFQGAGDVVQQDSNLFWDNTNKCLGIGATPDTSTRLDIRAQGALSTDITFRVRNSSNTANIFQINGLGCIWANGAGNQSQNTTFGQNALDANTSGNNNSSFGFNTLTSVTTGSSNTALGVLALQLLTNTSENTAIGVAAGQLALSNGGTYIGYAAGQFITTGTKITAVGYASNQSGGGSNNSFFGSNSGVNSKGNFNVGVGVGCVTGTTGTGNISLGYLSGFGLTTGDQNIFIGYQNTVHGITTGNYNVLLGGQITGLSSALSNNVIITDGQGNRLIRKDNFGNQILGSESLLSTSATDGFTYIPTCAGVPSGVPTSITGKTAIVVDSTNGKLYIYTGSAWVALN